MTPNTSLAKGFQVATGHHFTPGLWGEFIVLLLTLVAVRGVVIRVLSYKINTPLEVRPLDDATRRHDQDTHRLDIIFRDCLALSRLYKITTVPGELHPDQLIEVLNTPISRGRLALFAAALTYAFPRRAFIVTGTLLDEGRIRRCGVSIEVRPLGKVPVQLETQWSVTFERALQRAAFGVAAYITQQTRACKRAPWSAWARRRRPLPASLFRDYQRAKQMVTERRFDEALALYTSALRQDSDNIAIRYDVGQLYERLSLYPDALLTYLNLADEIFPAKAIRPEKAARIRVWWPIWWPSPPSGQRDPYTIRYRYVVVLNEAEILARDLISPLWPELQDAESRSYEERPWRAAELQEIRRLLSRRLHGLYLPIIRQQIMATSSSDQALPSLENSLHSGDYEAVCRYLLYVAQYEANSLIDDLEILRRLPRGFWTTRNSYLTPTAVRQLGLMASHKLARLTWKQSGESLGRWPIEPEVTRAELGKAGYFDSKSANWLEHYNAACLYALPLVNDTEEDEQKLEHAREAIAALERAARFGDDINFVTSKRYWLEGGDPDLAGLRIYRSFRAFEARIYGHPLPFTTELSKYEHYRHLRQVVRQAAQQLEDAWRDRAKNRPEFVDCGDFELWWRQELRAWEVAIRIGRFHPQWQTRHAAQEAIRQWYEISHGPDAPPPIPYPNITTKDYLSDTGDPDLVREMLAVTEDIFAFLGTNCGSLVTRDDSCSSVYEKTRRWSEYAAACSRSGERPAADTLVRTCIHQSAVWAALRQWAQFPGDDRKRTFENCIRDITLPPPDSC